MRMLYTRIQKEGNNGTSKAERNKQVSVCTEMMTERHKQILEIFGSRVPTLQKSDLSFSKVNN